VPAGSAAIWRTALPLAVSITLTLADFSWGRRRTGWPGR
jgi:hypothetical protein